MTRTGTLWILALGVGLVAFAASYAGLGYFIIDEVIYLFAAESFWRSGSFILENGLHLTRSGDLLWNDLLTLGPNGITAQYPPGTAFVWGPILGTFGERGVILFNAICTVGALFAIRALAGQLFGDERVALAACLLFLFGAFGLEYAFVYWPHMVAVWAATGSAVFFLRALEDRDDVLRLSFVSGLILGVGLLFRLDNILFLPAYGVVAAFFAARLVPLALGGLLGLIPAFIVLAVVNATKFGSANPLSYGGKAGLTNIAGYLPLAAGLALALLAVLAIRHWRVGSARLWTLGGVVAVVAAVALVPEARGLATRLANGVHSILVDARALPNHLGGIQDMPDGTKSFWGLAKKALGQSLPWLGALGLLVSAAVWRKGSRSVAMALLFLGVFALPFLLRSWHGGMSSNMRYFLPVLPFASALVAWLVTGLLARAPGASRLLLWSGLSGFVLSSGWVFYAPSGLAGAHQIVSLYVFVAVIAAAILAGLVATAGTARIALAVIGLGIGVSVFNTLSDTLVSQLRRHNNLVLIDEAQGYADKALIYNKMMKSALFNPEQVVAEPKTGSDGPDARLVEAALDAGYRVLMPPNWAEDYVAAHPGLVFEAIQGPVELAEVRRAR